MKKWVNSNITSKRVSLEDKLKFILSNSDNVSMFGLLKPTVRQNYWLIVTDDKITQYKAKTIKIGISRIYKKMKWKI